MNAVFIAILLLCIACSIRGKGEGTKGSTTAKAPRPQRPSPTSDEKISPRGSTKKNKKPSQPNKSRQPNKPDTHTNRTAPNKPAAPVQAQAAKSPHRPNHTAIAKPNKAIKPLKPTLSPHINSSSAAPIVAITQWNAGRLGNAIDAVTKALGYALKHRCDVVLPDTLIGLSNYTAPVRHFYARDFPPAAVEAPAFNASACDRRHSSHYWFFQTNLTSDERTTPPIVERLRRYVGINATQALGQACPARGEADACIAVHVRSGDVFDGAFNLTTGHWIPSPKVHALYEQPPLQYYLAAIRSFVERVRQRSGGAAQPQVLVACEDLLNPVCAVLSVIARTDRSWTIVRRDLLATLRTLTCCEEVLLSRSTLSLVLTLSPRLRHLHQYDRHRDCAALRHFGYNVTSYTAVGHQLSAWHNTELERHNMLRPYDMDTHTCAFPA